MLVNRPASVVRRRWTAACKSHPRLFAMIGVMFVMMFLQFVWPLQQIWSIPDVHFAERDPIDLSPQSLTLQPRIAGATSIGPLQWDPLTMDPDCLAPKWSQDGEDWSIYREYFASPAVKRFGTVLEMGALDGVGLSNSLFFERCLQWRSILIEGQPTNCQKLFKNRPRSTNVCMAICGPEESTLEFTRDSGPIAGAPATMSTQFKTAFHSENVLRDTVSVPCGPMSKYLRLFGITHIDFFSLDVEGAELTVLKTIDFDALTIDVMMVERDAWNNDRNIQVQEFLKQKAGLELHSSDKLTPRSDLFFRPGFKNQANYYSLIFE